MKPKIDFLTIAVTDLQKSVNFYSNGLGLPTKGIQAGNKDHCLFELDHGFSLVLYERKEFLASIGNVHSAEVSAGFMMSYIAESKAEVENVLQKAIKAGATKVGQVQDTAWGYSANFADPDGHLWEITFMPGNA